MKTKASAAAAAEDDTDPKKIRSSRSKRRRRRHSRSSSSSESPTRKRSKKHSKRIPDKKSKRSKASGSSTRRRRYRSLSPSRSLSSSSSPSSVARRSCSSCSSSGASERSVSPPPRSRSRDVKRKKGRGRDMERDHKGRKVRRPASSPSISASSGSSSSRSRSKGKSRKRRAVGGTKDGATTTRDKMEKDYADRRSSRSDMSRNVDEDVDKDEDKLAIAKEADNDIDMHKKNLELESSPSKNANKTEEIVPASGGNSDAQDLELILRQKALENFRKFRAAATMGGKTDNEAAGKEALIDDSLKNAGTNVAEAIHFQTQGSRLEARHSAGSPRSPNFGNDASCSWKQEKSAGLSYGAGSPGILEPAEAGGSTQLKGRTVESTHSASQFLSPLDARNGRSVMQRLVPPPASSAPLDARNGRSVMQRLVPPPGSSAPLNARNGRNVMQRLVPPPGSSAPLDARNGRSVMQRLVPPPGSSAPLDARNGRSVMQRLVPPPGSCASVNQRLGSSAGLNHVNGAPMVRSVVSIPNKERLDGSTHTTPAMPSEGSSPVESSGKVGLPLSDPNKAEGTNGENIKTSEASASNGSILSPAEDKSQPRIEDKDGFQKKTFSRTHDGEAVEVSYKVYIPKKTPALARRKLQR